MAARAEKRVKPDRVCNENTSAHDLFHSVGSAALVRPVPEEGENPPRKHRAAA